MAKIRPFEAYDPGFQWMAGLLHWDAMGPDANETWHIIGYSNGWWEQPLGGYDVSLDMPSEDDARLLSQLWAAVPITVAIACRWCRCYDYGPTLWKPNAIIGENRGPRCSLATMSFPRWPSAVYAGHIIVWPDL
jgi:hypothetical protein